MGDTNVPPPLFAAAAAAGAAELSASTQAAVAARGQPNNLNLDDIFGDVVFTPEGDTVFLSEQTGQPILNSGEGDKVATVASRAVVGVDGQQHYQAVPKAGGLHTTNLADPTRPALSMGMAAPDVKPTKAVPFRHKPQAGHQLQYAAVPKKARICGSWNSGLAVPAVSWTKRTKGRAATIMKTTATYSVLAPNAPNEAS